MGFLGETSSKSSVAARTESDEEKETLQAAGAS